MRTVHSDWHSYRLNKGSPSCVFVKKHSCRGVCQRGGAVADPIKDHVAWGERNGRNSRRWTSNGEGLVEGEGDGVGVGVLGDGVGDGLGVPPPPPPATSAQAVPMRMPSTTSLAAFAADP
jgi:hypothetical protein